MSTNMSIEGVGMSMMEILREHMNHMYMDGRIMNEKPSFSIGSSYTEEEWKKFMEYVDFMLDSDSEKDDKRELEKDGKEADSETTDIAKGIPVQSIEDTAVYASADDGLFNSIANPELELPDFVGIYLENPYEFIMWQEEHQKRTFGGEKPEDAFLTWYYEKNPSAPRKQNPYNREDWLIMAQAFEQWKRELAG